MAAAEKDAIAFRGGDVFDLVSKCVGVISPSRGDVELWAQ